MSFKKHTPQLPPRFLEFDEARKYIENMRLNKEKTLEAIDYMINHKEYYFLLKNLVNQFVDKEEGDKELFDYIFSRLTDCPKRKEDADLYKKIIKSQNKALKESFFEFIKNCSKEFKELANNFLNSSDENSHLVGFYILLSIPGQEAKTALANFIKKEKKEELIDEFLNYLYFYGDEKDIDILNELEKLFPSYKEKIHQVKESL